MPRDENGKAFEWTEIDERGNSYRNFMDPDVFHSQVGNKILTDLPVPELECICLIAAGAIEYNEQQRERTIEMPENDIQLTLSANEWEILYRLLEGHRDQLKSFIRVSDGDRAQDYLKQDLSDTNKLLRKLNDYSTQIAETPI